MYETYEKLLKEKGVRTADVCKATGLRQSMFSDWKSGKYQPKTDKLQKIADYFGVPLDIFTSKSPAAGRIVVKMPRIVPKAFKEKEQEAREAMLELINEEVTKRIDDILNNIFSEDSLDNSFALDQMILTRYHAANAGTQAAVRKLLDIEEPDNLLPVAAHAKDGATLEELQEDAEMLNQYPNKKGEEL